MRYSKSCQCGCFPIFLRAACNQKISQEGSGGCGDFETDRWNSISSNNHHRPCTSKQPFLFWQKCVNGRLPWKGLSETVRYNQKCHCSPCNDDPSYSFLLCVKKSVASKVQLISVLDGVPPPPSAMDFPLPVCQKKWFCGKQIGEGVKYYLRIYSAKGGGGAIPPISATYFLAE